jgi:NAD(P)-dependent dehydrogenase (short-subunit alcohol dehydrogenase family)
VVNFIDAQVSGSDLTHASYILSKHLLATLTTMTALQYAPGITVNAVAPGLILPRWERTRAISMDWQGRFLETPWRSGGHHARGVVPPGKATS